MTSRASSTVTRRPATARYAAAIRLLCPAPATTTSGSCIDRSSISRPASDCESTNHPVGAAVAVFVRDVGAAVVAIFEQQKVGLAAGRVRQSLRVLPWDQTILLAHDDLERNGDGLGSSLEGQALGVSPRVVLGVDLRTNPKALTCEHWEAVPDGTEVVGSRQRDARPDAGDSAGDSWREVT